MAFPIFTFNNSTGSDTAASGAGPTTALSGTSASYSGSVFTLDGSPDLSGVLTDGSHVIWVQTDSGRQFFTINAVDDGSDTVTVDDAPAGTTTGLTWGLGGKRKTLDNTDSRLLFSADAKIGWVAELEDNQTVASAINWSTPIEITSDNTTHRVFTCSTNDYCLNYTTNNWIRRFCSYLHFQNSYGGGKTLSSSGIGGSNGNVSLHVENCIFGDATNTLFHGIYQLRGILLNCEIKECLDSGLIMTTKSTSISGCWIHDNTQEGIETNNSSLSITDTVIADNGADGIYGRGLDLRLLQNCVVDGNGGDGVDWTLVTEASGNGSLIQNNQITGNGGYGIRFPASMDTNYNSVIDYNNFGTGGTANASGKSNNNPLLGSNNIEVEPRYLSSINYSSLNPQLKDAGYPQNNTINLNHRVYNDIGIQRKSIRSTTYRIADIDPPIEIPERVNLASFSTEQTLNAAGEAYAIAFYGGSFINGNLAKIKFYAGVVSTSGDIDITIETLNSSSGEPTGTLLATGAEQSGYTLSSTGWNEVTLDTPVAITPDTKFAVVITNSSGSSADWEVYGSGSQQGAFGLEYDGATWSAGTRAPLCQLELDTGQIIPTFVWCKAISTSSAYDSADTPDERGGLYQFPFAIRMVGIKAYIDLDGPCDVILYDTNDNALETISLNTNDTLSTEHQYFQIMFSESRSFAANEKFRVSFKPTDGSLTIRYYQHEYGDQDERDSAPSFGQETTRTDGGAWTEDPLNEPFISFYVDGLGHGDVNPNLHPLAHSF